MPTTGSMPEPIPQALARAEAAGQAGRLHEAAGICRDILAQDPLHAGALALLGVIAGHRGKTGRAIALLERAAAQNPDNAIWQNNLCSLYRLAGRLEEATRAGQRALALAPAQPAFRLNLAKALMDSQADEAAISAFLDVLALVPHNAEAHLGIGQILLARGDFAAGWREYEWRNKLDQARGMIPDMHRPEWNGMNLPGSTLLLIADQGYGDAIMFARFIPQAAARAGRVVLACGADLAGLLRQIPGVAESFSHWAEAPAHHAWCLLSSLPGLLGADAANLPPAPYLAADPGLAAQWRRWLDRLPPRAMRVGLCWAGRPSHPNDQRRSLRLAQLAPLLALPGIAFVALQKWPPGKERAAIATRGLYDPGAELADFAASAALLEGLDLVISVDSAMAHLAGALGRPVWMLCPEPADWRWQRTRAESVWYPSLRILRQARPGDWAPIIERAAAELPAALAASSRPPAGAQWCIAARPAA